MVAGSRREEQGGGVPLAERESSHLCLAEDLLKKVNIVDRVEADGSDRMCSSLSGLRASMQDGTRRPENS